MDEPLSPGARGAFLLQLAALVRQATVEAIGAAGAVAQLSFLARQRLDVEVAPELAERLRRARENERRARSYLRFVTHLEAEAMAEHARLLAGRS